MLAEAMPKAGAGTEAEAGTEATTEADATTEAKAPTEAEVAAEAEASTEAEAEAEAEGEINAMLWVHQRCLRARQVCSLAARHQSSPRTHTASQRHTQSMHMARQVFM